MMQKELETAIAIARLAGKTILEHYATDFETHQKLGADNHYEPVTIADREASRIIVEGLEAAFPSGLDSRSDRRHCRICQKRW